MNLFGQVGDSLAIRLRVSDTVDGVAIPRALDGATLTARVRCGLSPDSDDALNNTAVSTMRKSKEREPAALNYDRLYRCLDYCCHTRILDYR